MLSVQFSHSVVSTSLRPHGLHYARPPCPSPTPSLLKLRSIESVMPSSHLILCRPLLLLPAIPHSIRFFSNESTLPMRWPKYWSFSFNISPSNEHPGLISFRMDWMDSLLFFGTLHSNGYIFPFLLCFLLLVFSQLFIRPPQIATLLFCISFSWGMVLLCTRGYITTMYPA